MRRPFRCLKCKRVLGYTGVRVLALPQLELTEAEDHYTVVIEQVTQRAADRVLV